MAKKRMVMILKIVFIVFFAIIVMVLGTNVFVYAQAESLIIDKETASVSEADCIVVFGAGLYSDGSPSLVLSDRLDMSILLYNSFAAPKIIISGDHRTDDYNEVAAMKKYLVDAGVPAEDIFMDHAGLSTYATVARTKYVFGAKKAILVTQEYHLYRALYIADALGLEASGVPADFSELSTGYKLKQSVRESVARVKDFVQCIFKPEPKGANQTISLNGSGLVTDDTINNSEAGESENKSEESEDKSNQSEK